MSPSKVKPPLLTILTPTWNRRHLLPRLYQSLLEQNVPEGSFEWLVVDDGSTDGTAEWLAGIVATCPFSIRVLTQRNGGKHRAVNRGARELIGGWVMILDSDDWIVPSGLARALEKICDANPDPAILAIISPRSLKGKNFGYFNALNYPISFSTWMRQNQVGDTNVIMRSATMRAYPFPEYEGEFFIAESSSFSSMFRDGGILLSNEIVAGGEYQPDGLSANSVALRAANPLGAMHSYRANLRARVPLGRRLRCQLNYHRFWWHALTASRKRGYGVRSANPLWLLPGWLMYLRDLRSNGQQNE